MTAPDRSPRWATARIGCASTPPTAGRSIPARTSAYVFGGSDAGDEISASEPLAFTGHGPERPPPKPIVIPPSEQKPASPAFDRQAAAASLGMIDVRSCRVERGADGAGHVLVVFANDGSVSHVELDSGDNEKTPRGACVERAFKTARVPPFAGAPVRVGKSFAVD